MEPGRRSPKIKKISVVIDNRPGNRPGRLSRGTTTKNASFSTIRAHFFALTAEDRLQFLSWLFEGVLSRCFPPPNTAATSTEKSGSSSKIGDTPAVSRSSRKGLPWSAEEDRLLVELKEEKSLAGAEVIRRFDHVCPEEVQVLFRCTGVQSSASGNLYLPKIRREWYFTYSSPRGD